MKSGEAGSTPAKRVRIKAAKRPASNKIKFTPKGLQSLKPPDKGHALYWDKGDGSQPGLSLAVNSRSKTYRSNFSLKGKPFSRKIGRLGEMVTDADLATEYSETPDQLKRMTRQQKILTKIGMEIRQARDATRDDRAKAAKGIDPRKQEEPGETTLLYKDAVELFIEMYAKPRQRSWEQTQAVLLRNCKDWLDRDVRSITVTDAYDLLDKIIKSGRGYTAGQTLAWLKPFWRFLWKRDLVDSPVMDKVEIDFERKERNRVFSDKEIKAIWDSAGQFNDPVLTGYFRLLILLAPRKSALAWMRPAHIVRKDIMPARRPDQSEEDVSPETINVWVTPHELTKSSKTARQKREYYTPLPPLALSIIQNVIGHHKDPDLVFPGRDKGTAIWPGSKLKKLLVKQGAPANFTFHAVRHSVGTWFENQGHSDYEQKLILNHTTATGATRSYAHGSQLMMKLELLRKWSDHVEAVVSS